MSDSKGAAIEKILWELYNATPHQISSDVPKALTAIYEIGLGVIGDPESEDDFPFTPGIKMSARNELRASQRKAWAKACGVKL